MKRYFNKIYLDIFIFQFNQFSLYIQCNVNFKRVSLNFIKFIILIDKNNLIKMVEFF